LLPVAAAPRRNNRSGPCVARPEMVQDHKAEFSAVLPGGIPPRSRTLRVGRNAWFFLPLHGAGALALNGVQAAGKKTPGGKLDELGWRN